MHRIGLGYDRHRLEPLPPAGAGRPLLIAGVALGHDRGPVAHSDGDALLHALTDAILGAIGGADIGTLFPDDDPANAGRDSRDFVMAAASMASDKGWKLANLDGVVLLERPKLAPVRDAIRREIFSMLQALRPESIDAISIKGKTGEGIGPVGRGRLIEAHVVVLLSRV